MPSLPKPVQRLVLTIGHSTRSIEEFAELLQAHEVTRLVDVRTVPRSRTNPQFNKDVLPGSLEAAGIDYVHLAELGGLRKPRPDSINQGWRNLSFRGYADYMQTAPFAEALEKVIGWSSHFRLALMCAEAVPWRCHRSLIADALTVRGIPVEEIVTAKKRQRHRMTPFAAVAGTEIIYPAIENSVPEPPSELALNPPPRPRKKARSG